MFRSRKTRNIRAPVIADIWETCRPLLTSRTDRRSIPATKGFVARGHIFHKARRWRAPVSPMTNRPAGSPRHPLQDVDDELLPYHVRFPHRAHWLERLVRSPAFAKNAIEPDKCGDAVVRRAMNQDLLALVHIHRCDECPQVLLGRSLELYWDVDVVHPQAAHTPGFIGQRVTRIVVQREIDDDLHALSSRVRELCLVRLAGGQETLINLTKVPRVAEKGGHRITVFRTASYSFVRRRRRSTTQVQIIAIVSAASPPQKIAMKMVNASESFTGQYPCNRALNSGSLQPISTACPHPKNA